MYADISSLEKKGYVRSFDSAASVREFSGEDFYESKLFVLKQVKGDVVKHRVLLDCKKSSISVSSERTSNTTTSHGHGARCHEPELNWRPVGITHRGNFPGGDDYEVGFLVLDIIEAFLGSATTST